MPSEQSSPRTDYGGYMCEECTNEVGWVGRHEKLCSVHWLKAKILGVVGFD